MKKIKFAIDFDDTITATPQLFFEFIQNILKLGHEVRIVTFRHAGANNTDIHLFNTGLNIPIIFTDGRPKYEVCKELNWVPDIQIDDHPGAWGEKLEDIKF